MLKFTADTIELQRALDVTPADAIVDAMLDDLQRVAIVKIDQRLRLAAGFGVFDHPGSNVANR